MEKINIYLKYNILNYINQISGNKKWKFKFLIISIFIILSLIIIGINILFNAKAIIVLYISLFSFLFTGIYKSITRIQNADDLILAHMLSFSKYEYIISKEFSRKIIFAFLLIWLNILNALFMLLYQKDNLGYIYLAMIVLSVWLTFNLRINIIRFYIYTLRKKIPGFYLYLSNLEILVPIFVSGITYIYFVKKPEKIIFFSLLLYISIFVLLYFLNIILKRYLVSEKKYSKVSLFEFFKMSFFSQKEEKLYESNLYKNKYKQEIYLIRTNPPAKFHLLFIMSITPLVIFYSVYYYLNTHEALYESFLGLLILIFSPFIFYQQMSLTYVSMDIDGKIMVYFGYIKEFLAWKIKFKTVTGVTMNLLISIIFIVSLIFSPLSGLNIMLIAIALIFHSISTGVVGVLSTGLFPNYKWEQITDIPTSMASITNNVLVSTLSIFNAFLLWISITTSPLLIIVSVIFNVLIFYTGTRFCMTISRKRLLNSKASLKLFLE